MRLRSNFNILNVLIIYSFLFLAATSSISNAGTGDFAGGGNGSQNKVYESNITPLIKLPIYNKYIKPRLDKLDVLMAQLGQRDEKSKFSTSHILIGMKSWYFTDDTLKSIDKETLGVLFNEDNTQQIALNKKKEIWIDNKIFSKMKEQYQADLIIHEIVMNLYFIKYYSLYDICIIGKEMGLYDESEKNNLTCEQVKNIKYFQTKQSMVLKEDDYQNIRRVTSWFINDLMNASAEDLFNKLRYNDFDKRLITKSDSKKDFKISGREIENLLLKLQLTDSFPENCKSSITNENLDCKISIKNTKNPYGADFNKLEFQIQEGNNLRKIAFNITNKTSSFSSPMQSIDGLNYFSVVFKSNESPLVLTDEVGGRFYMLSLFLSPTSGFSHDYTELIGYSLVPFTITSISTPKDNSIYTECEVGRLNLKKHPAFNWGSDERSELMTDFSSNLANYSKFYCVVRSQEIIDQMLSSKAKVDEFMKSQKPELSKIIGKSFEFVSTATLAGTSINSLTKSYENNLAQVNKELSECNTREAKNNRACTRFITLKFINEDTVLVDNKYSCSVGTTNFGDYKLNSDMKYIKGTDITLSINCYDNNLVISSNPYGRITYRNGNLIFTGAAYEYKSNVYQPETLYKEIP